VYGGFLDKVPFGAFVNKALTIKSGQTHVQRYLKPLLGLIEQGRIDPSFVISHTLPLEKAPEAYAMFRDKQDECIKVVLKPGMKPAPKQQSERDTAASRAEERLH
jgi:threonine dehydrogenase-like Zn-dependent dehydrogenase